MTIESIIDFGCASDAEQEIMRKYLFTKKTMNGMLPFLLNTLIFVEFLRYHRREVHWLGQIF